MIGRMLFAIISGQMLGSVVSGFANDAFGWRSALFIAAGVGAVAAAVAWLGMPAGARGGGEPRPRLVRDALRPRLRQPEGGLADAAASPSRARSSTASSRTWASCCSRPRARGRQLDRRSRPASSSAPSASAACSTPSSVRVLLRLLGVRRMCLLGSAGAAACYAALAFAPTLVAGRALAMFVAGLSFYMLHNSMQTEATELAPSARGSAVALFACGFFIGQGLGPLVFGGLLHGARAADRRSSPSRRRSSSSAGSWSRASSTGRAPRRCRRLSGGPTRRPDRGAAGENSRMPHPLRLAPARTVRAAASPSPPSGSPPTPRPPPPASARPRCSSALRAGTAPCTPNDFGPTPLADLDRPRRRPRDAAAARAAGRLGLPQQPARLARPARPTASSTPRHAARERYGAGARRARARHLDLEHRRDRGRLPHARRRRPLSRRQPQPASCTRRIRSASFVQEALGLEGPCVTVSTACSSSAKVFAHGRAADPPRPGRRGDRRRRRHAVRQRPVRLQRAAAGLARAVPAVRRRAQRHQHRRGGRLRAARARDAATRRRPRAARLRRIERRAPHVDAASRRPRRRARARRRAGARRHRRRATIDYINLHGTASAKNDEVEAALVARRFPARTHASSTKGCDRPHARRGRHRRGGGQPARDRARLRCRARSTRATLDPACGPQIRIEPAHGAGAAARSATRSASAATTASCVFGAERRDERGHERAALPGRGRRLLGADAARLGRRARRVPRRGAPPAIRRPSGRRPRCSRRPSGAARPTRVALALEVAAAAVRDCRPRPGDAAVGLRLGARRPRDQRLHVLDARERRRR